MTSSVQSLSSHSDDGGSDEQQKHPDSTIQHPQLAVTLPSGMVPSTTGFIVPHGRLDMAHTVPAAYQFMDPYYGSVIAGYQEGQPAVHPYFVGVHPGLPLPSDTVEEPVYVNAKQYHGILRRRQSRAKAESENKLIKSRKPYLHESRHLHALKRARGSGGRFLTAKDEGKPDEGDPEKSENKSTGCSNNSSAEMQQSGGCSHDSAQSPAVPGSNISSLKNQLNGLSCDKSRSAGILNSDNSRLVRHRAS